MHVSPSAVSARLNGMGERLRPRGMQVLVMLAHAGGRAHQQRFFRCLHRVS
jgi:hypothetical protein